MPSKAANALIVLTTVAKKSDAARIAKTLVEERLAACVSTLPAAESRYVWKNKLCLEKEIILLIKTLDAAYERLEKRLKTLHPYECPEMIALPVKRGYAPYLQWLSEGVC